METILKSGCEKILKLFYENKDRKIHLRDIARKTKLNENSVTRFLKQLEKTCLESEMDGNMKKYFIKKNNEIFSIFLLFDLKKYSKLLFIRKQAIEYFLNSLPEKPLITVLFGSTAKRINRKDSDIDLLLIVNRKIEVSRAESYAESQTAINVNSFQITWKDFLNEIKIKQDKVIQSALNSGYPISNNVLFYQEVLK